MAYIGKSPDGTGVRSRFYFTATGGETSLSGTDDNNATLVFADGAYVDVYLNGVLLVAGTDYNTSTANTISGLTALAANDIVEILVFDIFTVADTVSASSGGTFNGGVNVSGDLTVDTSTLKVDSTNNRVGIGTASPAHLIDAIVSSGGATARFGTTHSSGDNDGTVIISNGGSGDAMLRFDYEGSNTDRARIGVASSGQDLKFFTAGNNERMKILASGHVEVGDYDDNGATKGLFIERGATEYAVRTSTTLTSSRIHYDFRNTNGRVGSIATSGSSTSYSTSSDHRLKEAVVDMTGAITRVKQLAPKRFNFIADDSVTVDGFLAHEAQTVVPEAVTGTHNEVDADGNPVYQGIDQSKLVPLLTAALKESIAKIETLEAKVTALENA